MTRAYRFVFVVLAFGGAAWPAMALSGDGLERRGFFGARLSPIPEEARDAATDGVYIEGVFPESSASNAGFQAGDILVALDGEPLEGEDAVQTAVQRIAAHRATDRIDIAYLRNGERAERTLELRAMPTETDRAFTTRYESVAVENAVHRLVLTLPEGDGPFPTFFYIQGLGCGSIEYPFNPEHAMRQLIAGVTKAGYATVRVEKSGMGDSNGAPSPDNEIETELKANHEATGWLLEQPELRDPILFGHSMGGVFAPIVAQRHPVRGVVAYGTIGIPLAEYFVENERRQAELRGQSATAIERQVELTARYDQLLLEEKQTPGQILDENPEFRVFLSFRKADDVRYFGRHYRFWQQLNDITIIDEWKKAAKPSLIVWGESDIAASRGDHVFLAREIPGATLVELPGIDHGFDAAASMTESIQNRQAGTFNPVIVDTVVSWMDTLLAP